MKNLQEKYLFVFDIDGTLLPPGTYSINKNILEEMKRLKKLGHIIAVCTGRSIEDGMKIEGIELFDYQSMLLGSYVKSNDKTIIFTKIPKNDAKELITYLEENNYVWTYTDDYRDKTICTNEIAKKYSAILVEKEELENDLKNDNIFQMLVCSNVGNEVKNKFPNFKFHNMPGNYTDVAYKDATKSNAVNYMKSMHPDCKCVVIGDSANDLDMFKDADISIAMGNASDYIKSQTKYTTKSLEEDGVIFAIRSILSI